MTESGLTENEDDKFNFSLNYFICLVELDKYTFNLRCLYFSFYLYANVAVNKYCYKLY